MFGLSPEEFADLSDDEIQALNSRMGFVKDAMPSEWLSLAEELKDSAELLWSDRENRLRVEGTEVLVVENGYPTVRMVYRQVYTASRSYFLLAGFALENLIKGFLVARDPIHITSGDLSRELRTHKLSVLVSLHPSINLDEHEQQFVAIAQQAIPYWGRYPVPLAHGQVVQDVGIDDELHAAFLRLFERLSRALYNEIKDGWDSGVGAQSGKLRWARYGDEFDPKEPLW